MVEQATRFGGAEAVSRVLVVDDDPDINRLLRARLTARGFQVATAANGEEALVSVATEPPDLLFLDVSMPGMSGLEVLDQLRSDRRDLSVIMTTAFGSEQVAIDALRRGADDYLRKPFEPQEFQSVVDRTVERLRLRRENAALQRQLNEKRLQLEEELGRAARVQADLLPNTRPEIPGFEFAAKCIPANDVGGDFFDWEEPVPGTLNFSVGDAMGKGMPAALLMATVRAALRPVSRQYRPSAALELIQEALGADLLRAQTFMTLFHARLTLAGRRLGYVDAGHGYAFVYRASGTFEELEAGGMPLGMIPGQKYQSGSLVMDKNDTLVVFTDGLVDPSLKPHEQRAHLALKMRDATSTEDILHRLIEAAPPEPRADDITVLVLRCTDAL